MAKEQMRKCERVREQYASRLAAAEAEAQRLRGALDIYAKPENWQRHKRQERIIWNYDSYQDGFKLAQAALAPADAKTTNEEREI